MPTLHPEEVDRQESETRRKYAGEGGVGYSVNSVSRLPGICAAEYFDRLLEIRLEMARNYARGMRVLDVGCATGVHLAALQPDFQSGIGLDFSHALLERAMKSLVGEEGSMEFVEANARKMPFRDASFDFVYSFSALFYMPNVEEVLQETSRVLAPGGRCLLEMGNSSSLNNLVAKAHPGLARPFHLNVSCMREALACAGLRVEQHRVFQILPYWGERPGWIRPLLHPFWKRCLEKSVGGRMMDEWVASLPLLRGFAFRHLFACVKKS